MRLNIDDKLWLDPRFDALKILMAPSLKDMRVPTQCRMMALGALVLSWKVAQEYWCDKENSHSLIPYERWAKEELPPELFEARLAEKRDGGVYMVGTAEAFSWWDKCCKEGQKGGRPKKTPVEKG